MIEQEQTPGPQRSVRGGFDAPISDRDQDKLGRWSFARDVYRIAVDTPSDWSVRIGVFGEWGSGKSSVLRLIEKMAMEDGHVAFWFNPWGLGASTEVWNQFRSVFVQAILESGLSANVGGSRFKTVAASAAEHLAKLAGAHQVSERVAKTGMAYLRDWLAADQAEIQSLLETLDDKRVIVLVDDLDRTDPLLVPEVLHAVREVLDLPALSFVLGFDPHRVTRVLETQHVGLGGKLDFLEKIIDFSRWLPEPEIIQLQGLLVHDLRRYCPFVDVEAVMNVAPFLPRNPRTLRRFIRSLSVLGPVAKRHDPGDLPWGMLVLLNLLKAQWPSVVAPLVQAAEDGRLLATVLWRDRDDKDEAPIDALVLPICKSGGVLDPGDQARVIDLARALAYDLRFVLSYDIASLASLAEKPPVVTAKEFRVLLATYEPDRTSESVERLAAELSRSGNHGVAEVLRGFFLLAVSEHSRAMDRACQEYIEAEQLAHIRQARTCVALASTLSRDLRGFSETGFLMAEDFGGLLRSVRRWCHFRNHSAYLDLRDAEHELLRELVSAFSGPESGAVLEQLRPWSEHEEGASRPEAIALSHGLARAIEPTVARHVASKFSEPRGISSLLEMRDRGWPDYVLFRPESPLWTEPLVSELASLAGPNVQANVLEFLLTLTSKTNRHMVSRAAWPAEAIRSLWSGAVSSEVNPRMLKELSELKATLESMTGIALSSPGWAGQGTRRSDNEDGQD